MLRREGRPVNAKSCTQIVHRGRLAVQAKVRKKIAQRSRVPVFRASRRKEKVERRILSPP